MDWTKRKILAVYILFGVGAVLMTFPTPVGFFPLIIALLIGWVFRFGKDHDSLIYQHMIYISRTFWMWSALLTITTAVAGAAVITVADNSIYDRILDDMRNGIMYSNIMMVDALKTYIIDRTTPDPWRHPGNPGAKSVRKHLRNDCLVGDVVDKGRDGKVLRSG